MNSMQDFKVGANTVLQLLALTAMVFVAPIARSAALAVQPQVGEPTTKVAVSGSGMGAFEDVDLRYDGTTLVSTRADATGAFKAVDVEIPAAALPGRRPITALGHSSGTGASVLFLVRTNWPQFHRGPFRHGFTPHENVLDPTNVSQLKLLWGVPTGAGDYSAIQSSSVLSNGLVYAIWSAPKYGRLMALDAASGALRWSKAIGSTFECGATPAVAYGRVYVPSSNRIAAYDARTGALRWRSGEVTCSASGTPTAANGRIFTVDNIAMSVEARDAVSGKLVWRQDVCVPTPPAGCESSSAFAPLAVADGVVYVANTSGAVLAYSASSGRRLWAKRIAAGTVIDAAPVVEGDVVYISAHDSQLYALNRNDGSVLWSVPTGKFNHSTPALADGVLYVGSDGQGVTAFDAKTGAVRWHQAAVGIVRTSPAVANGVVYLCAGDGRLYALDSGTGTVLHSRQVAPVGRYVSPSPAVADGVVYVGTGDRLLAFGLAPAAPSNTAR